MRITFRSGLCGMRNKKMRSRDPELNSRWGTICTPTRMIKCEGTLMDGTKVYADREFALSSLF